MALLILLYILILLALTGVAIYEHITISTLSLPVSPALTILTILLPLLSLITTFFTPPLLTPRNNTRTLTNTNTNTHPSTHKRLPHPQRLPPLLPYALPILHLLLTTILTTLYTSTLTSPTTSSCLLSQKWITLWKTHNAPAIRAIQDALACCGFRSTRDMAWPFPRGSDPGNRGTCEVQFGRRDACLPGWEGALRGAVGGEVGVVVCVGVLQVVVFFLMGGRERGGRFGGGNGGWMGVVERMFGGVGRDREGVETGGSSRRPLLAAAPEGEDGPRVVETGVVDEEEGERDGEEVEPRREGSGYGAVGGVGPRVEPAHHDPWAGV